MIIPTAIPAIKASNGTSGVWERGNSLVKLEQLERLRGQKKSERGS